MAPAREGSPALSASSNAESWEVDHVSVQLTYSVIVQSGKDKAKKSKTKNETKNKELSFAFENTNQNYLDFLTALLKKHGQDTYTPISESHRFGIKIVVPPKKA
jgi:hypothetical protein